MVETGAHEAPPGGHGRTWVMTALEPAMTPAVTSECPLRYLVADSTTTSNPSCIGLRAHAAVPAARAALRGAQACASALRTAWRQGLAPEVDGAGKSVVDDGGELVRLGDADDGRQVRHLTQWVGDGLDVNHLHCGAVALHPRCAPVFA